MADTKSITIASPDENQSANVSLADLQGVLNQHAKYKERSYDTSKTQHVPFLDANPSEPRVVLFGHSLLERMKTTGQCLDLQPWPSTHLLSTANLAHLQHSQPQLKRLEGVFNAGVGGDKITNLLYRLLGDPTKELVGLIPILSERDVRLWIVQAGTNDLHQKHGFQDKDRDLLRLLLQTLLKISRPGTRILLTGLFYRKDISDELVDEGNRKISALVTMMNTNLGREAIVLLPAPKEISKEEHLEDHVHLNFDGYVAWIQSLFPKAAEMLEEANTSQNN